MPEQPCSLEELQRECLEIETRCEWLEPGALRFHLDLSRQFGDLYCDAALRAAGNEGVSPEKLAKEVLDQFSAGLRQHASFENGYLNFTVQDPAETFLYFKNTPMKAQRSRSVGIVIPLFQQSLHPWEYLRIVAAGFVHFLCCQRIESEVDLWIGAELICDSQNATYQEWSLVDSFRDVLLQLGVGLEEGREFQSTGRFYDDLWIWSSPGMILEAKDICLKGAQIQIRYPVRKGWQMLCGDFTPTDLLSWQDQELHALLLLLTDSAGFDAQVARFEEQANLSWYVGSVSSRLNQFLSRHSEPVTGNKESKEVILKDLPEDLPLYISLYGDMLEQAAIRACPGDIAIYTRTLLNTFLRWFHNSALRSRVEKTGFCWLEQQVLSELLKVLQDLHDWYAQDSTTAS